MVDGIERRSVWLPGNKSVRLAESLLDFRGWDKDPADDGEGFTDCSMVFHRVSTVGRLCSWVVRRQTRLSLKPVPGGWCAQGCACPRAARL